MQPKILIVKSEFGDSMKAFVVKSKEVMDRAKEKMAFSLLNYIVNSTPPTPPILEGTLRGSGSVFVGSKFICSTPGYAGKGNPNQSHTDYDNVITVGFNVSYAARMHETDWNPGPVSKLAGDTGNKFIEKHLASDGPALMRILAAELKDEF